MAARLISVLFWLGLFCSFVNSIPVNAQRDRDVFLNRLKLEVNDCIRTFRIELGRQANCRANVVIRVQRLIDQLNMAGAGQLLHAQEATVLIGLFTELLNTVTSQLPSGTSSNCFHSERTVRPHGDCGAPRYNITEEQLKVLVSLKMTNRQIASVFQVSPITIRRRMRLFGMHRPAYSRISDDDLDISLRRVIGNNRRIGQNSALVRLQQIGLHVQRHRVREALHRIDPAGVVMRSTYLIPRRPYRVPGPNSLWHIDGNHKLIRWKFVIHGAIDGSSRLVVFLQLSTNNRADTVFNHFLDAVATHGVPSGIRIDHGGENNLVADLMLAIRGQQSRGVIRGSSVHNQRIERLWSDVWAGSTNVFWELFQFLEEHDLLNPLDEVHLAALHYVFLPRIQDSLNSFLDQWNNHGLRTEGRHTPRQLFVMRTLSNLNRPILHNILQPHINTLIQPNHRLVDPAPIPMLSEEEMNGLHRAVNPRNETESDQNSGLELYLRTLCYIKQYVH